MNQAESGRSLVEMLAVIGIIGVLSIGIISGIRWGVVSGGAFRLQNAVESAAQELQGLCAWNTDWDRCAPKANDFDYSDELIFVDKTSYFEVKNVSQRVCRRLLNPNYTTWTKGLIGYVEVGGSSYSIPPAEDAWRSICGGAFGGDVSMKFYVEK